MRKITVLIGTPEELHPPLDSVSLENEDGSFRHPSTVTEGADVVFVAHPDGHYECIKHRFGDPADIHRHVSIRAIRALIGDIRTIGYNQGPDIHLEHADSSERFLIKCKKCDNIVELKDDPAGKVVFCSEECMRKN